MKFLIYLESTCDQINYQFSIYDARTQNDKIHVSLHTYYSGRCQIKLIVDENSDTIFRRSNGLLLKRN